MNFFLILFILFIIGVLIPVGKLFIEIFNEIQRARRNMKRFHNQFKQRTATGSRSQQAEPQKKRKKINPDDGEFVSFEELPPCDTPPHTTAKLTVEQQIVDVEWEEIKTDTK